MNRRRFFLPSQLHKAASNLHRDADAALEGLSKWARFPSLVLSRQAMACTFEIQLGVAEPDRDAALKALDLIERLEDQLTVYDDASEVSKINQQACARSVVVEQKLFALLARCQQLSIQTDGAFDISTGPLIRGWGFRRRQGRAPTDDEIDYLRSQSGMQHLVLDPKSRSVRFTQPGMEINLGGVGKGYALDRVRHAYQDRLPQMLLSAGRSSLLAVGRPYWDTAWQLDILHPLMERKTLAVVRLKDQGFSTSGVAEQHFWKDGKRYSHIIDPRTGQPVQGMLQVSAVAPDAAWAEVLSTAFFVNGADWTEAYCAKNLGVGAVIIPDPGISGSVHPTLLGEIDARVASE